MCIVSCRPPRRKLCVQTHEWEAELLTSKAAHEKVISRCWHQPLHDYAAACNDTVSCMLCCSHQRGCNTAIAAAAQGAARCRGA